VVLHGSSGKELYPFCFISTVTGGTNVAVIIVGNTIMGAATSDWQHAGGITTLKIQVWSQR
jgi:hypothetical protein